MNEDQQARLAARVIAALDLETLDEALGVVDQLEGLVRRFKIGSRMFTRYGPAVLEALGERGCEVFLDLKFHDIPSVVADAVRNGARFDNVFMMTIHAAGGAEMVRQAAEAAAERTARPPLIVAVTALTSLSADEVRQIGVEASIADWAGRLGRLAVDAGADGLVCSAHEAAGLREAFGREAVLVTPGIRLETPGADDDQTRVMTPHDALEAGSDYLVIGRPIYKADDPAAAARRIGESL